LPGNKRSGIGTGCAADIYIRVSTFGQATRGDGLVRQLNMCARWIKENGFTRRSIIQDICSEWKSEHLMGEARDRPESLHRVKDVWFGTEPFVSRKGNLARAIMAWKSRTVAPPSLLVFEEWDRLDRRRWLIESVLEQLDMRLVSVISEIEDPWDEREYDHRIRAQSLLV
jgi:DNA invertase Pin-like site-specific DNA recombinase